MPVWRVSSVSVAQLILASGASTTGGCEDYRRINLPARLSSLVLSSCFAAVALCWTCLRQLGWDLSRTAQVT